MLPHARQSCGSVGVCRGEDRVEMGVGRAMSHALQRF